MPTGLLYVAGNYSAFLEKKAEFLHAQSKRQESLENRVRTEMEWLRRGPKARATKAKARIDTAHEMIGELADLRSRSRTSATDIDFAATDRKTKRLIHLEGVAYGYDGRTCSMTWISRSLPACAWDWWDRTAAEKPRCCDCC